MKETVLGLNKDMKFYFCPEYVNMQKGIDSLCGFIRSNLMRDPFSNEVFIFMGRNKKQIKILRWDEDKFILYTVKLYTSCVRFKKVRNILFPVAVSLCVIR